MSIDTLLQILSQMMDFALLFSSSNLEFLEFLVCLWTFKWVGGPLVGDYGCAVFIVESTNPKNMDLNKNLNIITHP